MKGRRKRARTGQSECARYVNYCWQRRSPGVRGGGGDGRRPRTRLRRDERANSGSTDAHSQHNQYQITRALLDVGKATAAAAAERNLTHCHHQARENVRSWRGSAAVTPSGHGYKKLLQLQRDYVREK
ncbi:hypothetical protein SprV_0902688500 [Sparganum proliferum]